MFRIFQILTLIGLCIEAYGETRTWTLISGKSVEAEYVSYAHGNVNLENDKEAMLKIPFERLSEEDRTYVELINPPELDINFWHKSNQLLGHYAPNPFNARTIPPELFEYVFGVRVKQLSLGSYSHELKVEYFVIGRQLVDRDKYILLDRRSSRFTPSEQINSGVGFSSGKVIRMHKYLYFNQIQGRDYAGHLVLITDSRGEIVAYKSSQKWMFEHRESLRKLPLGAFIDYKTGARTFPSGPTN
jgi:hypothetical protein